jgi:hypothetical protein
MSILGLRIMDNLFDAEFNRKKIFKMAPKSTAGNRVDG